MPDITSTLVAVIPLLTALFGFFLRDRSAQIRKRLFEYSDLKSKLASDETLKRMIEEDLVELEMQKQPKIRQVRLLIFGAVLLSAEGLVLIFSMLYSVYIARTFSPSWTSWSGGLLSIGASFAFLAIASKISKTVESDVRSLPR